MSAAEIAYRLSQKLRTTIEQLGVAPARHVPAADTTRPARPFIAHDVDADRYAYARAADRLLDRLQVFDKEYVYADLPEWNRDPKTGRAAPLLFGKTLDYRDDGVVGNIKYLWEINRHLELVTLAQAYRLTNDAKYADALRRLIESWFDQCPYLLGVNWASSLELGIRLINWAFVWQLIGGIDSALFLHTGGAAFRDRWLAVIYQHMHFIQRNFSRFSSANNHLIGEAAGLYVATTTWPYWPAAARWRARARRELIRETIRQNAPDGVNREQALAYQQFVLDFLLIAGLAAKANADDFPVDYWQRLERMLEFLAAVMDVGGNVPMIGDADDGYVVRLSVDRHFSAYRSLLATGAVIFRRGDFKAKAGEFDEKSLWLLGKPGREAFAQVADKAPSATLRRAFPDGGYYVLGRDFDTDKEIRVVADAGPLGYKTIAAHGHADALAFTLSIAGAEFLVDPGTYSYHSERWWRDYFRGTAAHNTVRIDAQDQSVIGGSFLWVRHAQVHAKMWQTDAQTDSLVGWHDGYARLADPVRHERELVFDKNAASLEVVDVIECSGPHRVEWFWHFAEDVTVIIEPNGVVVAQKRGHSLQLVPQSEGSLHASMHRGEISLPAGWVSRRFGVKSPGTTVVWQSDVTGTTRFKARLECTLRPPQAA